MCHRVRRLGKELKVEIRGQGVKAMVVPTPFYKRTKKGVTRASEYRRNSKIRAEARNQERSATMPYPADYKYTKEHEWIKADGKNATIGITHYAQESLGDIVFVDLPKVGAEIAAGKTFGSVESVKAVSDLYAPVSGTVTESTTT